MTIISSMVMAQQALLVNQAALSVASNNITNMNTDSYSRERVELIPGANYTPVDGSGLTQAYSGTGVELQSVTRYNDEFLKSYYRMQNSDSSYLETYSSVATNIESLSNELNDTGLATALSDFYTAVQTFSNNPDDAVARSNYVSKAEIVAMKFNSSANGLDDIRTSLVGKVGEAGTLEASQIYKSVDDVNSILKDLATINGDIIKSSAGSLTPGALLDQRDELLNKLSALVPVTISENSNSTINVSMNDIDLIKGTKLLGTFEVETGDTTTPAVINIKKSDGTYYAKNINNQITSGSIGAILDAASTKSGILTVQGAIDNLNDIAGNFADIINTIQNGDPNLDGTTAMAIDSSDNTLIPATEDIFVANGGGTIDAFNISINSLVESDPYLVSAARLDLSVYTDPSEYKNAVGNNSNMLLAINSRTQKYPTLGNNTIEGAVASFSGEIGTKVEDINNNYESKTLVKDQVKERLSSAIGVNMDEELTDLIKYQNAYQASARIFSVCNDLLGDLVHLGE